MSYIWMSHSRYNNNKIKGVFKYFPTSDSAFHVVLVGFSSVDSLVDPSVFSCDWVLLLLSCLLFSVVSFTMLSYSMGYSKFNGQFTVLFITNNTLAALTLSSLFGKSSMIFPIFHDPLGKFAFIWNMYPLDGISFASTRRNSRFICDLCRRLNR